MIQPKSKNIKKSNLILVLLILALFLVLIVFILDISINESFTDLGVPQSTIIDIEQSSYKPKFHYTSSKICSQCHLNPIIVECTSCHPNPPMTINENISFPHHDPNGFPQNYSHDMNLSCSLCHDPHGPDSPIIDCSSEVCHDAADDVRFVTVREGNLTYCMQCHEE